MNLHLTSALNQINDPLNILSILGYHLKSKLPIKG